MVPAGTAGISAGELMVDGNRLYVGARSGTRIELLEVQVEGKKRMPVGDFLRGATPHPHESLGMSSLPPPAKPPSSYCWN